MKKKKDAVISLFMVVLAIGIFYDTSFVIHSERTIFSQEDRVCEITLEESGIMNTFWGLGKLIKSQGGDSELFTDIGVGVALLFSAGGFLPGAIIGL